jgi:hypothetical protein
MNLSTGLRKHLGQVMNEVSLRDDGYYIGRSLSISADDKTITYSETATEGDIWMTELTSCHRYHQDLKDFCNSKCYDRTHRCPVDCLHPKAVCVFAFVLPDFAKSCVLFLDNIDEKLRRFKQRVAGSSPARLIL